MPLIRQDNDFHIKGVVFDGHVPKEEMKTGLIAIARVLRVMILEDSEMGSLTFNIISSRSIRF
jgi:hypothetical protein